jgi:hypothetical protein
MSRPDEPHICWGCQKPIGDGQPHIHIPLDEWGEREGLGSLGIGDLIVFPFCEPCTVETKDGWQLEQHKINPGTP